MVMEYFLNLLDLPKFIWFQVGKQIGGTCRTDAHLDGEWWLGSKDPTLSWSYDQAVEAEIGSATSLWAIRRLSRKTGIVWSDGDAKVPAGKRKHHRMRSKSLEDRRIILKPRSRGHQRLASANRRSRELSRSTRRLDRPAWDRHIATGSCDHSRELSARVYLFSIARHPTGGPVGPAPCNRKTVSRLDGDRLRGRFRDSTRMSTTLERIPRSEFHGY